MNTLPDFRLTAADLKQLEPYLQHDPENICFGIPDVVVEECAEFLDILSEIRNHIPTTSAQLVHTVFVKKVFEKALLMILNKPIVNFDTRVVGAGIEALWMAYDDLQRSSLEGLSDEARAELTDWDNGMIACAIIKACGRAAKAELVPS